MTVYTGQVHRRDLLKGLGKLCSRHRYAGGESIFIFDPPKDGSTSTGVKVIIGREKHYGASKLALITRLLGRVGISKSELYEALGVREW